MTPVKTTIALLTLGFLLAACGSEPAPTMQSSTQPAAATPAPAKAPDENAALEGIKRVHDAQSTYFKVNRRYALTFEELIEAHLLTAEPTAADTGYEFKLRPAADAQTYKMLVTPAASTSTVHSFYTDQMGIVRAESGKDATVESPVLAK